MQLSGLDLGMDIRMGFHKVTLHSYTGGHESATELHKKYNKFSDKNKEILRGAMRLAAYDMSVTACHKLLANIQISKSKLCQSQL